MQTNSGADSNLNRVFQRNGQKNHRGRGHQLRQSNPYKSNGQNGGRSNQVRQQHGNGSENKGRSKMRCFNCQGFGHFAKKCPSKNPHPGNQNRKFNGGTHQVSNDESFGKLINTGDVNLNYVLPSNINMVSDVPMLEIGQLVHQNEELPMEQDILSDQEFVRKMDKIIADLEKKASVNSVEMEILNEVKKNLIFTGEISETQEEILLNEGEIKESVEIYSIICSLSKNNCREIMTLNIENQSVSMEIDTGAVVSVCSEFYF